MHKSCCLLQRVFTSHLWRQVLTACTLRAESEKTKAEAPGSVRPFPRERKGRSSDLVSGTPVVCVTCRAFPPPSVFFLKVCNRLQVKTLSCETNQMNAEQRINKHLVLFYDFQAENQDSGVTRYICLYINTQHTPMCIYTSFLLSPFSRRCFFST